ncbi:MAG: hypothetical protein JSV06_03795, partial [Myxococcales bacterium]
MGPRLRPRRWLSSLIPFVFLVSPIAASAQDTDSTAEPYRPGDVVTVPEQAAQEQDEEEFRDRYGSVSDAPTVDQVTSQVRYVLEGIVVTGNSRTKAKIIRKFVPLKPGDFLDPESPELLETEWRLM